MKNVYQKIGKLLGEWRRKNGFSLYKIAKEGPGNVRYDSLKRVEKGDVVSSETFLCYIDFCYEHGFRIFDEIYNNITLQQCIVVENEQTCETKKESVKEVPAPLEEEEKAFEEEELTPPLDEEYAYAEISFGQKEVMNEHDQIAFIKHKRCPVCGKALRERNGRKGSFIGCSQYPKCNYTANGDFSQYSITENNKKGVIPK